MQGLFQGSKNVIYAIGLGIFLVAFIVLFWPGDYRFFPAVFLALLIAILATIIIYLLFRVADGEPLEMPGKDAISGNVKASAPVAAAAVAASATPEAEPAPEPEPVATYEPAPEPEPAATYEPEPAATYEPEPAATYEPAPESEPVATYEREITPEPEPEPVAPYKPEPETVLVEPTGDPALGEDYDGDGVREGIHEGTRPAGLDAPRGGQADDLKMVKGIGAKMEILCNSLGFWHFDQLAGWNANEVAWVDANLQGFKGRVTRDGWVEQARVLASGGVTEFSKRVEDGDVY